VGSKSKQLRSGYTTGACAAAAAKAATLLLVRSAECGVRSNVRIESVTIPFPDGSRIQFGVLSAECGIDNGVQFARASVIKDAGDDPDITNGAEIVAEVRSAVCGEQSGDAAIINVKGGRGVGTVTKPGLAIPVGEAAINPVPRKMILAAVQEAVSECKTDIPHSALRTSHLEITISVPQGEELAKKTLNHRLGIIGGISILGTTGIVKPLSEAAWTATITASFDVAKAQGIGEVVVSTGRTSEKAHQKKYAFPAEAYAMMGDFAEFSLADAKKHGFRKVHLCAQWAKMVKIAMGTPETHVRHGALEAQAARDYLVSLGMDLPKDREFNTTREIFDLVNTTAHDPRSSIGLVCKAAKRYCETVTGGVPVSIHLVSYEGEIIAESR